jgi:hypothetical protein
MTTPHQETPCDYCGTILDENGKEESTIAAAGPRMTHFIGTCRERVHAALRGEKTAHAKTRDERDEAREWVRKLTREERVLTCIYCGHAYPPGSPTHGAEVLTAHAATCEQHPLAAALKALHAANWVLYRVSWNEGAGVPEVHEQIRQAIEAIRGPVKS